VLTALAASLAIAGPACWLGAPPAFAEGTPAACNLYASNAGSDSNIGSQSAPFLTLRKLASSLAAGQTGCLQSGQVFDSSANVAFDGGETHGLEGKPVTITSTNPSEPATITHSLALNYGVNYVIFTHLSFNWSMPKPWVCWNAGGDAVPGMVVSGPGTCSPGTPYHETAVQIGLGGKHDSFTYDDITSNGTDICFNLGGGASGWGEDNVLEHDRIHNCGPTVEAQGTGFPVVNQEWGWHSHGVYDYARKTLIKNDYIYGNSRNGVLFYGGGEGAVAEHNIIDRNGAGVWFGGNNNNYVAWNIITNSQSPRGMADYGIGSAGSSTGNVATKNCLYGNQSGEIAPGSFTATENKTGTDPLYTNGASHDYVLQANSPCLGYGPDTSQPQSFSPVETPPASTPPVETPTTTSTPVEKPAPSPPAEAPAASKPPVQAAPPHVPQKDTGHGWTYWPKRSTSWAASHTAAIRAHRAARKKTRVAHHAAKHVRK
jgi:hypothetical protein